MSPSTSPNLRLVRSRWKEPKKVESVLDLIGDTPLLQIQRISEGLPAGVKIYAKLEGFNPGGSVKDRPAWRMIQEGLRSGKLQPGKTILDSTSGNTGIALALVGSVLRYPVELVLPANVSAERKRIMGTGRYLKEVNPRIQVIAVEPDDALHGLEGLKHMASSIVPGIYHEEELDDKISVSTEDAYAMVYRLSQEVGNLTFSI